MAAYSLPGFCLYCHIEFKQEDYIVFTQAARINRVREKQKYSVVPATAADPGAWKPSFGKHTGQWVKSETKNTGKKTYQFTTQNSRSYEGHPANNEHSISGPGFRGGIHWQCWKNIVDRIDIEDITIPIKERRISNKEKEKEAIVAQEKRENSGRLGNLDD